METLPPPTPAWLKGRDNTTLLLDTRIPAHLARRGYRATWPEGAEVFDVEGVPSDDTVPDGILFALNTETDSLYVKRNGEWLSVNGEV